MQIVAYPDHKGGPALSCLQGWLPVPCPERLAHPRYAVRMPADLQCTTPVRLLTAILEPSVGSLDFPLPVSRDT